MRTTIWIPEEEIKIIDDFCKEKGYHRGVFLWKSALHAINQIKGEQKAVSCDRCKSPSIGRFMFTVYGDEGERQITQHLCKLHFQTAKTELGEVKKV